MTARSSSSASFRSCIRRRSRAFIVSRTCSGHYCDCTSFTVTVKFSQKNSIGWRTVKCRNSLGDRAWYGMSRWAECKFFWRCCRLAAHGRWINWIKVTKYTRKYTKYIVKFINQLNKLPVIPVVKIWKNLVAYRPNWQNAVSYSTVRQNNILRRSEEQFGKKICHMDIIFDFINQ